MTFLMWLLVIAGISYIALIIWMEYDSYRDGMPSMGGVTNNLMYGAIMVVLGVVGLSSGGPPEGFQTCGQVEEGFMPKSQIIKQDGTTWCSKELIYMQVIEDEFYVQ